MDTLIQYGGPNKKQTLTSDKIIMYCISLSIMPNTVDHKP